MLYLHMKYKCWTKKLETWLDVQTLLPYVYIYSILGIKN